MAIDSEELLAGMTRNEARLEAIMTATEKQQAQIDEVTKGIASLTASFDAYKDDIEFAKEGRTMLREHTVTAERQLQELRDMIREHERRLVVLEDASKQGTRDSEEGDNAVRSDMVKGFTELRTDIAALHSDIAELKAGAGRAALGAWKWVIGMVAAAVVTGLVGLAAAWVHSG